MSGKGKGQLGYGERETIERLIMRKESISGIGRAIGRSPSTVEREIKRNGTDSPAGKLAVTTRNICVHQNACAQVDLCGKGCLTPCRKCKDFLCNRLCPEFEAVPCPLLEKPPYCCNGCIELYGYGCTHPYHFYDAKAAHEKATDRKVTSRMGIDCTPEELDAAFRPNTKAVFGESISNPALIVLDFDKFTAAAHDHGVPIIVDNTFPTPVNCRPFDYGVDIVTHATTKYMDGHGSCVGGAIVDSGRFDWMAHADKFPGLTTPDDSYHGVTYATDFGPAAYIIKATAQLMRDFGSTPAPINSWIMGMHLESLAVRMERHCANALAVARFLEADPRISWVSYPGLEGDRNHALAAKYMPNGTCGVISFGVPGGRDTVSSLLDHFRMISIATHVADARSCTLYPAGTTHRQLTEEQLEEAGVGIDLVRLSCGIENADDIIADLRQAMDAVL